MTVMVRCPVDNCHNLMPNYAKSCGCDTKDTASRICKRCEKVPIGPGQKGYCKTCAPIMAKEKVREGGKRYREKCKLRAKADKAAALLAPKPDPSTISRRILSDEECDRLDAIKRKADLAYDRILSARCGYGNGAARVLSESEREAIIHTITPVHLIPVFHHADGAIQRCF